MNEEFDKINETLDIEVQGRDCEETKQELKKISKQEDHIKDYEYTRGNLYSLIEKGQEAINGILELAQEGQQPRSYEVVGQLIKSVGDVSDKLIDLQQKMKDLNKEDKSSPTTVNNALFVGSTASTETSERRVQERMKKKWSDKYKKSINCDNPKGFSQRSHCQGKKKVEEETNPRIPRKKGQPANSKKHSDLYTDENPKETIHG